MNSLKYLIVSTFTLLAFTSAVVISAGCKVTTDAATQNIDSAMVNSSNDTAPVQKGEIIRLMVSLLSAGEGPDRQASEQINKLVKDYSSQINKPIQYAMVSWGREGEVDFCFRLSNLDPKQQKTFVDKIKQLFEGRALVIIAENSPCNHIR